MNALESTTKHPPHNAPTNPDHFLSLAAFRLATGAAAYADRTGALWPYLPAAIASVARSSQHRDALALDALRRLDVTPPDRGAALPIYWHSLNAALTRWTLQPHDTDPLRLRRDDPALIARRLRGRTA